VAVLAKLVMVLFLFRVPRVTEREKQLSQLITNLAILIHQLMKRRRPQESLWNPFQKQQSEILMDDADNAQVPREAQSRRRLLWRRK